MKQSICFSFLLFLIISCTKDRRALPTIPTTPDTSSHVQTYDTIFPGDYYPLYPGSWWDYEDYHGKKYRSFTSPNYVLNSYGFDSAGYAITATKKWVPEFFNYTGNIANYLYKYSFPTQFRYTWENRLVPRLTENVGDIWQVDYDKQTGYEYAKVIAKDTTTSLNGVIYLHVIVVSYSRELDFNTPTGFAYFAKNIGLIKSEYINYLHNPQDTNISVKLLDFSIKP